MTDFTESGPTDMSKEPAETGEAVSNRIGFWPQLRRILIFQFKLYVDAFRDVFLSLLSVGAFLLDVVQQNTGDECHFERVLKLGRRTERAINLFNHYDPDKQDARSVDGIIRDVEERIKKDLR